MTEDSNEYTTTKIWTISKKLLKAISAYTGQTMVVIFHRLVTEEAKRLGIKLPD